MNRIISKWILSVAILFCTIFQPLAQSVYFPSGTKAYEKNDSIITFYKNNKPIRIINLAEKTSINLKTQQMSFLYTHDEGKSELGRYEGINKYDSLGQVYLSIRINTITIERTKIKKDTVKTRYNQYGKPEGIYNEYGNLTSKLRDFETHIYNDKQQLILYKKYDIFKELITENYYKYDSLGRLIISYLYDPDEKKILNYNYNEYPDDESTIPLRTYKAVFNRVIIDENIWHTPLQQEKNTYIVDDIDKDNFPTKEEEYYSLIDRIRKDEYPEKPWRSETIEITYISPMRKIKELRISRSSKQLTEYIYDDKNRLSEKISHRNDESNPTQITSHHKYTYDPENYDFEK